MTPIMPRVIWRDNAWPRVIWRDDTWPRVIMNRVSMNRVSMNRVIMNRMIMNRVIMNRVNVEEATSVRQKMCRWLMCVCCERFDWWDACSTASTTHHGMVRPIMSHCDVLCRTVTYCDAL
jgi:hypothetical protein